MNISTIQNNPLYPEWTWPLMNETIASAEAKFNHYPTSSEGFYEGGVDWTPYRPGTPITALSDGVIIGAGYFCRYGSLFATTYKTCGKDNQGYGVVTIRSNNIDGTETDIYYQHIIIASGVKLSNSGGVGQRVTKGQTIGYSNPTFNVEIGINVGQIWGGIWGTLPAVGQHTDPIPYLYNLISMGGFSYNINSGILAYIPNVNGGGNSLTTAYTTVSQNVHTTLQTVPGMLGIVEALDKAETFQAFQLPSSATASNPNNTNFTIFGMDTGIPNPSADYTALKTAIQLPSEAIQAAIVFISANTMAAAIRLLLIFVGIVLLMALGANAMQSSIQNSGIDPKELVSLLM